MNNIISKNAIEKRYLLPVILLVVFFFLPSKIFAAESFVSTADKQPPPGDLRSSFTNTNAPNFLEPFQVQGKKDAATKDKKSFNMITGSYSSANGNISRLGLDALKQKRATDVSGRLQGRLEDLIVPGNSFSNISSTPNFLTSIEMSYPVNRRLTLDGGYAVIKRDNRANGVGTGIEERRIPSLGASYTVNTNTSISVNYHRVNVRDPQAKKSREEHEASAELRINF